LDYLILTHGDADHMGESENIVKHFKVNRVLINSGSLVDLEEKLIKILEDFNIKYDYLKQGDVIRIKDYSFYALNSGSHLTENDCSIVLYTKINNYRLLLTGDISTKVEKELTDAYPGLEVDILKLGHHGSITSTSELFLETIKPKYGIISVGLKNNFNHPSPIVTDRLNRLEIKTLQTSLNGSIKMIFGLNDVTIWRMLT
ncbi:MAG: MBL fold metallo-hydrolase, partial [Bacilli bacterium]|jgi:competence protein ComEC